MITADAKPNIKVLYPTEKELERELAMYDADIEYHKRQALWLVERQRRLLGTKRATKP